jgi:hypothetical protein
MKKQSKTTAKKVSKEIAAREGYGSQTGKKSAKKPVVVAKKAPIAKKAAPVVAKKRMPAFNADKFEATKQKVFNLPKDY